MRPLVDRLVALAVILEGPHRPPQSLVVRGDHPTFAARGHDLVLAKAPSADVTDAADAAAPVPRPVRLSAVLDDFEPRSVSKGHDAVHVTRIAGQMHGDDG